MTHQPDLTARRAIRHHLMFGAGVVAILAVGLGGWAATSEFSGAVIAQGQLVVDTDVKKVQHPTGGVVGELRVHEGSRVEAGQIIVRLDETQTRASLAIVTKGMDELTARKARNEAERDGLDTITFPTDLLDRTADPEVSHVLDGERRFFDTRRRGRDGQKAQLRERISQLQDEIRGLTAQEEGRVAQIRWITAELKGVRDLWDKNLVPFTRVTSLERETARLTGERGQAIAMIAQTRGKISETELQILQIDQDMRTEVGKDLAEIRSKMSELSEKKISAEDQLKKIDIRAPQAGFVHELSVHTVGGVVLAGEPIMLIIPEGEALAVEAKLPPQDIDQVRLGQPAVLRFTTFNMRTTPELNGSVARISADVSQDPKTGVRYYTIRIRVPESEITRLGHLKLMPGMPVEAFIQTPSRTVLSYLLRPLDDQLSRSFREK